MAYTPVCNDEPINIVEIILDRDADGTSYHNSPDRCGFVCTPDSLWWSDCKVPPDLATPALPKAIKNTISSIKWRCSKIQVDQGLPTRGGITICFDDTPQKDVPGGEWSALIEDQRYWEGRKIRVYSGFCSQAFNELDVACYYIDKSPTVSNSCIACVTAKDPLALIDDTTSQCPDVSCYPTLTLRQALAANRCAPAHPQSR